VHLFNLWLAWTSDRAKIWIWWRDCAHLHRLQLIAALCLVSSECGFFAAGSGHAFVVCGAVRCRFSLWPRAALAQPSNSFLLARVGQVSVSPRLEPRSVAAICEMLVYFHDPSPLCRDLCTTTEFAEMHPRPRLRLLSARPRILPAATQRGLRECFEHRVRNGRFR